MRWVAALLVLAAALSTTGAARAGQRAAARVIATVDLPADAADGHVGGISGIDYDRRHGEWWLISDDKSEHAPARLYRLWLRRDRRRGLVVRRIRSVTLRDRGGRNFPASGTGRESVDGEAIRLLRDGRGVLWSSEGDPADGFGPAIRISERDGRERATVALPPEIRTDGRPNKTIEGLTVTPDGALWAAMEAPLRRDGPEAGIGRPALVRFMRFRPGQPTRQYAYRSDAVVRQRAGRLADNGVSEILSLDDDRLLVLERSGEQREDGGFDFHCRLYLADFRAAADVSPLALLDGAVPVAPKRLLIDFDGLMPNGSGNLEAMAWWTGHRGHWLLFANDNNFARGQTTRLTLIALPRPITPFARSPLAAPVRKPTPIAANARRQGHDGRHRPTEGTDIEGSRP